ncbi:hypothetical protein [Nocardia terpenica]|uniref:hypothetical protein n=1 Tax=Nocardia terpenica TaxID=455432 RepID=UPI001EEAA152|nr:hypothetical protein [Nocardia terpenica]
MSQWKTEGYGGHPMKVHIHRRQPDRITTWLQNAGFEVEAQLLLTPKDPATQAFLFARRRSP